MEDTNKGKKGANSFLYIMLGGCSVLIIIIVLGFAFFVNRKEEVIEEEEHGGNVVLKYTNNFAGMSIVNVVPTTDSVGMKSDLEDDYFDFSVDVSLDNAASVEYEISLLKDSINSNIADEDIRIYLERENSGTYTKVFGPSKFQGIKEKTELGSRKNSMVITKVKKTKTSVDNYRLRIWLSDKSLLQSGNYTVNVEVNGKAK